MTRTSDSVVLDTGILACAVSADATRSSKAYALLASGSMTGVQVLNEFVNVARRNSERSWPEVVQALTIALRIK